MTESTLDIGGGGVLMELNVTDNGIYIAADDGVYGYSQVTALVDDGVGYSVRAQDINYTAAEAQTGWDGGADLQYESSAEIVTGEVNGT